MYLTFSQPLIAGKQTIRLVSQPRLVNPLRTAVRKDSISQSPERVIEASTGNDTEEQSNVTTDIVSLPQTHSGQRLAILKATKNASLPVEELQRPLAAYMTLPASQYSVLDAKRIERIDEDTFKCYVGGLHFLNFHVEPVLTVSVIVGEHGPTVRLLETDLQGSQAAIEANSKFTATMTNVVTWQHAKDGNEGKEISSDTTIEVTLKVPKWFILPVSVIEKSGCAVMQRVLESAVPRFLLQLKADYGLWAAGDDSRGPVSDDGVL